MTDHLAATPPVIAAELRELAGSPSSIPAAYRDRLRLLAGEVDALASSQPVDAFTELTASFGLEPDQEIRDRALERAVALLAPLAREVPEVLSQLWSTADECAAYIRTGERPA